VKPHTHAAVTLTVLGVVVLGSCSRPPTSKANSTVASFPATTVQLAKITYQHKTASTPESVRLLVLVDSSGSMIGFHDSLPSVLGAVDQGISYSRDLYFRLESLRLCLFNQRETIFGCRSTLSPFSAPPARSATNLDVAIRQAKEADLTIVVSDGVPAGRGNSGDCSSGAVDAGCVARFLHESIDPRPGEPKDTVRGVWVVPFVTIYSGNYFSEQTLLVREFVADKATAMVQNDTSTSAEIRNPRNAGDGTLMYDYLGPRILAAIVIGQPDVARAFIQELYTHAGFRSIATLPDLKSFQRGVALLPPVELYPGYFPETEWIKCEQERDPRTGRLSGNTMGDCQDAGPSKFSVRCGKKDSKAPFVLSSRPAADGLGLFIFPPFLVNSFPLPLNIEHIEWDLSSTTATVNVRCNADKSVQCGNGNVAAHWTASADYGQAASAAANPQGITSKYVAQMSTDRPAWEPHKIYGFAPLLQNFYKRQLPPTRTTFASLEICQEP
jgi:hypothetical protein